MKFYMQLSEFLVQRKLCEEYVSGNVEGEFFFPNGASGEYNKRRVASVDEQRNDNRIQMAK